jgi:hypothetical protein
LCVLWFVFVLHSVLIKLQSYFYVQAISADNSMADLKENTEISGNMCETSILDNDNLFGSMMESVSENTTGKNFTVNVSPFKHSL